MNDAFMLVGGGFTLGMIVMYFICEWSWKPYRPHLETLPNEDGSKLAGDDDVQPEA